ncbi:MAG: M23 family metallopeptidase [Syntrophaceae bacterium]|nr:M23 family metallopeptidase [Syntrophaceae bacterium]
MNCRKDLCRRFHLAKPPENLYMWRLDRRALAPGTVDILINLNKGETMSYLNKSFAKRNPMKKLNLSVLLGAVVVIVLIAAGFFILPFFETGKPSITLTPDITAIGPGKTFTVAFNDEKSGLKQTLVTLTQNGKTQVLSSVHHPEKGQHSQSIPITADLTTLKLIDGPATLRIFAEDHSLMSNKSELVKSVYVDVMPAQIYLLNTMNHINPGGVCVTLYRTSEPVIESGVFVNDTFFKAYPITVSGKPCYVSYFAIPMDAAAQQPLIRAYVKDAGQNETSENIRFILKKKKFRSDKVNLSDNFLQRKMPDFQTATPELRGKPLIDVFTYVNTKMREDNFKTIQEICKKSKPKALWEGTFLRMKDASPMALFGDRRQWLFEGREIGESLHEGIDLASVERAPVQAANSGVVLFAGPLGIYGNTVIIDHGVGMISLYAHLSSIQIQEGQAVRKGDAIGNTGLTGLAGGDHLHFGIMVGGQFVNPIEWWDPHWIADNVTKKVEISF